jgi:clan AA aspartic protease
MVGRIYRTIDCTEHLESKRNPVPAIQISLYNIHGEKILNNVEAPVDAGYEGSIMLTSELYNNFLIAELPRRLWRDYRTLTGTVTMRVARAVVEINGVKFNTFIGSPLFWVGKLLVGREVLSKLAIVIDCSRKETCLVEALG